MEKGKRRSGRRGEEGWGEVGWSGRRGEEGWRMKMGWVRDIRRVVVEGKSGLDTRHNGAGWRWGSVK